MTVTSGYRCHSDNEKKRRTSTNHMGKAIDAKIPNAPDQIEASKKFYHKFQTSLVESSPNAFQIRWGSANKVSFEPAKKEKPEEFIATTWIHADVRNYAKEYLADSYFHKGRESVIKYFENNLIA